MDVKIHVTDRQGKEQIISGPTDMSLNLMELLKVHEYPVEGNMWRYGFVCFVPYFHSLNKFIARDIIFRASNVR
jgi:hypothetical protein